MAILAVPIGLLIGLSLGALGGGGSILTVPALVYVLGQSPKGATTASLLIVGITALAGMAVHLRAGRVAVREGVLFGLLGAGGSFAGSRLSARVDPHLLLVGFSVLMLVAAGSMVRKRRVARRQPVPAGRAPLAPPPPLDPRAPLAAVPPGADRPGAPLVRVVAAATVVGLVTGFFGVGGGFVVVPALVLALGFSMPVAVGTSLLVIAINSASALLFRLGTHPHLDGGLVAVFILAAVIGTLAGGRIASAIRPERLVGAFAGLLVVVALYTAGRSLPHLV